MPRASKKNSKGTSSSSEPSSAPARFDVLAEHMARLRAAQGSDDEDYGVKNSSAAGPATNQRHEGTAAHSASASDIFDSYADVDTTLDYLDRALATEDDGTIQGFVEKPNPRRSHHGAYRFTSLLDKLKKWRMLTTRAIKELDTPAELPSECSDPKRADELLVSAWRDAREPLEEMMRGASSMVSVAEHGRSVGALDYAIVEEQMVRILRQLVPLVRTVKLVAILDSDTPGAVKAYLRRGKVVCRAVAGLMEALETPGGDGASAAYAQVIETSGHIEDCCRAALKPLEKVVHDTRRAAAEERARQREAELRRRRQQQEEERAARKKEKEDALARVRAEREAAERELEEAKKICERDRVNMDEAIRRARHEAEQRYLEKATSGVSIRLRERVIAPDLSTKGFTPTQEGIYDSGSAISKEGFSADGRAFGAEADAAEAQKRAYIERLRAKHAAETAAAADGSESDEYI